MALAGTEQPAVRTERGAGEMVDGNADQVPAGPGRRPVGFDRWAVLIALLTFSVLAVFLWSLTSWLTSDPRPPLPSWLLEASLVAVIPGPIIATVGMLVERRQATDPATWSKVRRALRDGHRDDPRIDALAQKSADQRLGQHWFRWLIGGSVVALLAVTAAAGSPTNRLIAAGCAVLWLAALLVHYRFNVLAHRYLATASTTAAPHGPADDDPADQHDQAGHHDPAGHHDDAHRRARPTVRTAIPEHPKCQPGR